MDVRRCATGTHGAAGRRARAVDRGLLSAARCEVPTTCRRRCDRVPVRQPADRTLLRRGRRAGRHARDPLRRDRPGSGLGVSRRRFPHFGALTSHRTRRRRCRTRSLEDGSGSTTWTRGRGPCATTRRGGSYAVDLPLDPMHGTVGVAPAAFEARSTLVPDAHGGNMDTPEMRPVSPATWASTWTARSSRSATGTAGRARASVRRRRSRRRWTTVWPIDLIKGVAPPGRAWSPTTT